jgi:hypothetical protein
MVRKRVLQGEVEERERETKETEQENVGEDWKDRNKKIQTKKNSITRSELQNPLFKLLIVPLCS